MMAAWLLTACAPALPSKQPEAEVQKSLTAVTEAADQAEEYAEQARMHSEKTEELFDEAQALLKRAEDAQKRCETLAKGSSKSKKIIKRPKTSTSAGEQKGEQKKQEGNEPQWSPSDGPF